MALVAGSADSAVRFPVDLPAPLDSKAASFTAPTQPVSLARIVADLPVGQTWAGYGYGSACVARQTQSWESRNNDLRALGLDRTFRLTANEFGLKTAGDQTNLFEDESKPADVQVGALIRDIRTRICLTSISRGEAVGVMSMEVEWQIYSVSRATVIARIPTRSGFELTTPQTGALALVFAGAFADSVRRLAADDRFRAVVSAGATRAPDPSPAPADMTLALPRATTPTPLKIAAQGVVLISAGNAFGSGVLISTDGYLLTNHHVAGESGSVRVRWPDGTEAVGQVVRADKRRDVALIKAPTPKASALAIRHTPVELGETVYAVGAPREKEFAGTLTRGVVSAVDRELRGQHFIQSDVASTHGNSGGPLLDEHGWIVGLTDLTYEPGGVSQNINFFIPIDEALKALALKPAG